jgi:2-polyprenyl-3-methyl-5-hydroxy-6-metoxy-1,4-benzoquinol methylase
MNVFLLPDFSRRISTPELMDDSLSSEAELYATLGHFSFINRFFSGTAALFKRFIARDIERRGLTAVTIMDVGAGGGDFARWCSKFLARRGIAARLICLDCDERVIAYLRVSCAAYPAIKIVHGSLPGAIADCDPVDYCVTNNVMHHTSDDAIPDFMASMRGLARFGFLINDIRRSPLAYLGFKFFAGAFMRQGFTLRDGLTSIRKGFTASELRRFADKAGLGSAIKIGRAAIGNIYIVGVGSSGCAP